MLTPTLSLELLTLPELDDLKASICAYCSRELTIPPDHGGCDCELLECPICGACGYPGDACLCEPK